MFRASVGALRLMGKLLASCLCDRIPFIRQATNTIQVWNNGFGVPVDIHKEEGVYIPEMIFGHLLTSSNYDDNEKKVRKTNTLISLDLSRTFEHPLSHSIRCSLKLASHPFAGDRRQERLRR